MKFIWSYTSRLEDIFKFVLPFRQVSCCFSHRHQGNVPSCGLQWERSMVLGSTGLHAQKRWRMNFSFASWTILIKAPWLVNWFLVSLVYACCTDGVVSLLHLSCLLLYRKIAVLLTLDSCCKVFKSAIHAFLSGKGKAANELTTLPEESVCSPHVKALLSLKSGILWYNTANEPI